MKKILLFLGLALVLAAIAFIGLNPRKTVYLAVDGKQRTLASSARTIGELLRREAIPIQAGDRISPPVNESLLPEATITLERAVEVQILDGEQIYVFKSPDRVPTQWLRQAGLQMGPDDQLFMGSEVILAAQPVAPAAAYTLHLRRAVQVYLEAGAESRAFSTTAATLGQALEEVGLSLRIADHLQPPPETQLQAQLQPELHATLQRARAARVVYPEGEITLQTAAATVGEALAEAGLSVQGLDYTVPAAGEPLPKNGSIQLVHVQETLLIEQDAIPYSSELAPAPELELDQRTLLQAGEFGVQARRVRVRVENGVEVSRTVEAEWVARAPRSRIVGYGTKIVLRTIDTPDGPLEYWRAVRMYATSYSPCRIFKDRCDSGTALGAELKKGVVAMTNSWCRYTCGDRVYVPGYGIGTVLDTGGGIPGRYWIDLGYSDDDYVSWHHWVTVYFLAPVPDNYQVILP